METEYNKVDMLRDTRLQLQPKIKGKGNSIDHTLDIALLSEGTLLQKRSGMAHAFSGDFTALPARIFP